MKDKRGKEIKGGDVCLEYLGGSWRAKTVCRIDERRDKNGLYLEKYYDKDDKKRLTNSCRLKIIGSHKDDIMLYPLTRIKMHPSSIIPEKHTKYDLKFRKRWPKQSGIRYIKKLFSIPYPVISIKIKRKPIYKKRIPSSYDIYDDKIWISIKNKKAKNERQSKK